MSFFKKYIRAHRLFIISLLGICLIFFVTFAAYGIDMRAVLYPSILCIVFMAAVLGFGVYLEKRRHMLITDALLRRELIDETLLPPALTAIEEDYRELVRLLQRDRIEAITAANVRYDRLSEYYTLWAHQIKTPIASMRLKLADKDSETVRAINSDLLRIEQYVDMVMTYVRLDSSTTDYQFRECSLDEIISQSLRKFSGDFISKKLGIEYEPSDIRVLTDDKWLGFVIEQLLANSVKYTTKGSISITAECVGKDTVVTVADTGIGISPDNLPRLFEMGFTGYNGRMNNRASGIGLYLCKRICDNLGIAIAVASEVGHGTSVSLTISSNVTIL